MPLSKIKLRLFATAFIAFLCVSMNSGKQRRVSVFKANPSFSELRLYAMANKMDTTMALVINYSKHSGLKRGYVADLKAGVYTDSFMVSHGCGNNNWGDDMSRNNPVFSNTYHSHCSSLGRYRIGKRGYSAWGINVKYLLHGLDTGNSNALGRIIVLHGWSAVSEVEVYPSGTPEGWGCPAVSNSTMHQLDSLLKDRIRPVLLWTFYK